MVGTRLHSEPERWLLGKGPEYWKIGTVFAEDSVCDAAEMWSTGSKTDLGSRFYCVDFRCVTLCKLLHNSSLTGLVE